MLVERQARQRKLNARCIAVQPCQSPAEDGNLHSRRCQISTLPPDMLCHGKPLTCKLLPERMLSRRFSVQHGTLPRQQAITPTYPGSDPDPDTRAAHLLAGVITNDADLETDTGAVWRQRHLLHLHKVQACRVEPHETCTKQLAVSVLGVLIIRVPGLGNWTLLQDSMARRAGWHKHAAIGHSSARVWWRGTAHHSRERDRSTAGSMAALHG